MSDLQSLRLPKDSMKKAQSARKSDQPNHRQSALMAWCATDRKTMRH